MPSPPMRTTTPSGQNTPTPPATPQAYSPSVPLSVYRELAAELQAAEAMIDALNGKNQHLTEENQQLRQEIERAVQAVLQLQKVVDSYEKVGYKSSPFSSPDLRLEPSRPVSAPRPQPRNSRPPIAPAPIDTPPPLPEKVFTEQEEGRYRRPTKPETAEVSGWWLAIAILLIVITAFGAGYLIVRPLLQNQSR